MGTRRWRYLGIWVIFLRHSRCRSTLGPNRKRKVEISLTAVMIYIDWRDDGVWMTGATLHVFDGMLTTQFLESLR